MALLPDGVIVRTASREEAEEVAATVRRAFVTEAEIYGVDADWRGRGIARALMLALETAYPRAPRIELFTGSLSVGALALYDSLGYAYVRTQSIAPGIDLLYFQKVRE